MFIHREEEYKESSERRKTSLLNDEISKQCEEKVIELVGAGIPS